MDPKVGTLDPFMKKKIESLYQKILRYIMGSERHYRRGLSKNEE